MNETDQVTIACPSCGELISITVDITQTGSEYVEDCSVCCRPMRLLVELGDDDIPVVTANLESD